MSKVKNNTKLSGNRRKQQAKVIIAFSVIPMLLLFMFTYLPFAEMVGFSFYKMKYIGEREFVGLKNYIDLFAGKTKSSRDVFVALKNCLYYMVGSVVQIALALFLATVLSTKVKGGNLFKGLIFFPYLVNGIAIGFIFKFFFAQGFVLDTVLGFFGVDNPPQWLMDQSINNWSLVGASLWRYMGQNMVLFIGAIMSVDPNLYEAAELDGANGFQKFRYIILPSIKTIVTLNVILAISGAISVFEIPYVITSGSNGTDTYFIVMDRIAHGTYQKVGLASAMAVVLLVIILLCTIAQKLLFKYIFRNADAEDEVLKPKKKKKIKAQKGSVA